MSDRSLNVECPDCGQMIFEKNVQRHYRRLHPGLDPVRRMKETKAERKIKASPFETRGSPLVYVVAALAIVGLLLGSGFVIYNLSHEAEGSHKSKPMRYTSSDGAVINGTFYMSGTAGSHTIYLFHDLGQDRHIWDSTAEYLQTEGYNVVAVDLRGHGSSVNNVKSSSVKYDYTTMADSDFAMMQQDLVGAVKWVTEGVNERTGERNTDASSEGAVVLVGKLGAVLFYQAAHMAAQWGIDSGVYADPVRNAYGFESFQSSEDWGDVRPLMLASSDADSEVHRAVKEIGDNRPENAVIVSIGGADRGAVLLEDNYVREMALQTFSNGFEIANS